MYNVIIIIFNFTNTIINWDIKLTYKNTNNICVQLHVYKYNWYFSGMWCFWQNMYMYIYYFLFYICDKNLKTLN